jgi:uncharacterized protein (TIGR03437 family)
MTHASLCKKTYEKHLGFQGSKVSEMCSRGIVALIFLASAGVLSAQIEPTSVPNATLGIAYSVQLQDVTAPPSNFPVGWSIVGGSLPPGINLNTSSTTGTTSLSGTPTTAGFYSFTVQDTYNTSGQTTNTQPYSISVAACKPSVTPTTLNQADVSIPYPTVHFMALGCPGNYTFTFSENPVSPFSPNLPPGLSVSPQGIFSGTPTAAGAFQFLLTITDQSNDVTQIDYSLTINSLPTITTASPLPNGPLGVPYSQQIAAKGGVPPYTFSMDGNVPGLTISPSGVFSGTPTNQGTFDLRFGVADQLGGQSTAPFQVTFGTPTSQLQISPSSITFNSNLDGAPPPTQAISIVPALGTLPPVTYTVTVDNGQSGTAAPAWITVTPLAGVAPASLVVSANQADMFAGSYPARIQIIDSNGLATAIAVSLNVASQPQQLTVASESLSYAARSATPGSMVEELAVSNSGAGTLAFTTSVVGKSPWITGVTAGANTTALNAPVFVQVQVNTSGLAVGAYHDAIQVSSSAGNVQVPVSLFVANSGPILAVDTTGVLFQAIQGGGSTSAKVVKILNLGDPNSSVNWTATLVSGSNWLNLVSSSGTATTSTPGNLGLALAANATQLAPGAYYAIIKVADSNSKNSPQYISAVLNLQPTTAAPAPDLAPAGLFFTAVAGGTAAAAQAVQVNTSSTAAATFNASTSTADGGTWLSVTPNTGTASGQTAGSLSVSADPTSLAPGIYSGSVSVSIGALLESVNVTFVVQPAGASAARPATERFKPEAAGCTASKLAITETGLPNNFAVPAGWPATLIVQLNDDCANAITSGNVIASFSNGDGPLSLVGDNLGNYSATWQPSGVNANMVVTLNGTSGPLQPATAKLYGGIANNQTPPPTVFPNGAVNNLNPVAGAALSPGTITQVYGTGLGTAPVSTGGAPLPNTFNNTFALVGPTQTPLYFLSSGQINIQIPDDAASNQQLPIVLSVNNALTVPQMLTVVPATPGVLSANDGPTPPDVQNGAHIIAQHSADFSLVSSSNPAKPGEFLVMYLVGMGATNPSVASGTASPTMPLGKVTAQPNVTVDSQPATVAFAGLTPGFVGLYQINFQVPKGAKSGELVVTVTQNGVAANPTLLPVN